MKISPSTLLLTIFLAWVTGNTNAFFEGHPLEHKISTHDSHLSKFSGNLDQRQTLTPEDWTASSPAKVQFRRIGQMTRGVGYAHIIFTVNTKPAYTELTTLCSIIRNMANVTAARPLMPPEEADKVTNYYATFNRIQDERCQGYLKDFENLRKLWASNLAELGDRHPHPSQLQHITGSSPFNRPKRLAALGVAAATALVLAVGSALYNVLDLLGIIQNPNEQIIATHINEHELQLNSHTRSLQVLNLTINELAKHLQLVKNNINYVARSHRADITAEAMFAEWERLVDGLQLLTLKKLSPRLIDAQSLGQAFRNISAKAKEKGLALAVTDIDDAFKFPISYITFRNHSIAIFVHIPVYQNAAPLEIYKFISAPVQIDNQTVGIPRAEHSYLVTNPPATIFTILTEAEFQQCTIYRKLITCPEEGVYYTNARGTCLSALFHAHARDVGDLCSWNFNPTAPSVTQLYGNLFAIHFPTEKSITLICPQAQSKISFKGVREVYVPPYCTAQSSSFKLYGRIDMIEHHTVTIAKEIDFSDISEQAGFPTLDGLQKALNQLHLVGSTEGITIKQLNLRSGYSMFQGWINLIISYAIPVIVGVVIFTSIWLCRQPLMDMLKCATDAFRACFPRSYLAPITTSQSPPQTDLELTQARYNPHSEQASALMPHSIQSRSGINSPPVDRHYD